MESSPQTGAVASSSTLAERGESMHALILAAREGEGLLCSEESDGVHRWHHYLQSRSPLQPGEDVGRGSRDQVARSSPVGLVLARVAKMCLGRTMVQL